MHSGLREYEILLGIDRRISDLKSELKLLRQENIHSRDGILERLKKLEKKPVIDWQAIIQNFWFKLALLGALATGNTQLVDLATAVFQK